MTEHCWHRALLGGDVAAVGSYVSCKDYWQIEFTTSESEFMYG